MSNSIKKNGKAAKGGLSSLPPSPLPSVEEVKRWVRKDLEAANYLLGIVLRDYPEVVNGMATSLHDHIMKKERGAAIDHTERLQEEAKGYADS